MDRLRNHLKKHQDLVAITEILFIYFFLLFSHVASRPVALPRLHQQGAQPLSLPGSWASEESDWFTLII